VSAVRIQVALREREEVLTGQDLSDCLVRIYPLPPFPFSSPPCTLEWLTAFQSFMRAVTDFLEPRSETKCSISWHLNLAASGITLHALCFCRLPKKGKEICYQTELF